MFYEEAMRVKLLKNCLPTRLLTGPYDSKRLLYLSCHFNEYCRLPEELPKNVKFVISTLPDSYGILKSARSLGLPADNFVEVKTLDVKSAWVIIDKWLEMHDRKVG